MKKIMIIGAGVYQLPLVGTNVETTHENGCINSNTML